MNMQIIAATTKLVQKAVPVWAEGREKEMNLSLGFRSVFQGNIGQNVKLKITASTLYRVFVNGTFVGSGPARAAHGYFRIDEYDVGKLIKTGENIVAVEVAGYNVNSYYTLDQPSFLLAELDVNGNVILATGDKDFEVFRLPERIQKVERYSFQRPFTEYYRMTEDYNKWRTSTTITPSTPNSTTLDKINLTTFPMVKLLPRHVLLPKFNIVEPESVYAKGTVKTVLPQSYRRDRSLTKISPVFKGFPESELEVIPSLRIQEIVTDTKEIINKPAAVFGSFPLRKNEFCIYGFGIDYSGFIGAKIMCNSRTKLYFYFDELLTEGDVKTKQRMDINNQIGYELNPGVYDLETFESYTFKYLKIIVTEGDCRIDKIYLREFSYPENEKATFHCSNFKLNAIYAAAKQSSRQNALDVLMDCPSRERGGWLCDSYYAAIMEKEFTGYSAAAHNLYESYALPESFKNLPEGMIPMCYPADLLFPADSNDNFIPQWSLWFILQIDDYQQRGGDSSLVTKLKPRIENLLKYFTKFENEDGLLEKLDGWKFVEWSKANEFVMDVNYPTNMLYCAALDAAAHLYGNSEWAKKAEQIKQTIIRQSFNGDFFIDNALRKDGKLIPTNNTTEVCQYYAFFFNIVTPESHPELWKKLVTEFGPNRNVTAIYPSVYPANAFVGNYMRMDILSRYGLQSQLLLEIQNYFYAMADQTGTLWENMTPHASCNHGFASYIGHVLYRDVLGISQIDYLNREITIRFSDLVLDCCSGSIPIGEDVMELKWTRSGNKINYSLKTPKNYKIKIQNDTINTEIQQVTSSPSELGVCGTLGSIAGSESAAP
jgi:alpha-L-rhamnosidase